MPAEAADIQVHFQRNGERGLDSRVAGMTEGKF